jgi:hypothetical protein
VDNEKIENVPLNERDYTSLLAITAGVQRTPGGGYYLSALTPRERNPTIFD